MLGVPAAESLAYMDMEMQNSEAEHEKERARVWLNFLVATYTAPSMGGKEDPKFVEGKKQFIEAIKPEEKRGPTKIYDWDDEVMKRLTLAQERGGL